MKSSTIPTNFLECRYCLWGRDF